MEKLSAKKINQQLQETARQFPGFANIQKEGESVQGRPIYSLSVGKGETALICTGGVHGRESINPSVLVKMTKKYCEKYTKSNSKDKQIARLNTYRILFIPLLNPDGYEVACNGFGKIKDPKRRNAAIKKGIHWSEWRLNSRGIDLNRNFPCQSYCKQNVNDEPFSEVESRILASVFKREPSIGYLDFHSRGKELYWYRAAMDEDYNKKQKEIAERLHDACGYRVGTPQDEMQDAASGGNTVQYYAEQYKLPAITIETVEEEAVFPLKDHYLEEVYKEIFRLPLIYLDYWDSNPVR